MASHLFDKAATVTRPSLKPQLRALATILDHPTLFVATIWIVFYVALALTR
jgi:hypothetical protein